MISDLAMEASLQLAADRGWCCGDGTLVVMQPSVSLGFCLSVCRLSDRALSRCSSVHSVSVCLIPTTDRHYGISPNSRTRLMNEAGLSFSHRTPCALRASA